MKKLWPQILVTICAVVATVAAFLGAHLEAWEMAVWSGTAVSFAWRSAR